MLIEKGLYRMEWSGNSGLHVNDCPLDRVAAQMWKRRGDFRGKRHRNVWSPIDRLGDSMAILLSSGVDRGAAKCQHRSASGLNYSRLTDTSIGGWGMLRRLELAGGQDWRMGSTVTHRVIRNLIRTQINFEDQYKQSMRHRVTRNSIGIKIDFVHQYKPLMKHRVTRNLIPAEMDFEDKYKESQELQGLQELKHLR